MRSTLFRAATVRERPTGCRAHIVRRSLTVAARKNFDPFGNATFSMDDKLAVD